MLKLNKRAFIFGFLAILLVVPFGINVLAETQEEIVKNYRDTCDIEMLENKYKLSIEKVASSSNQYRIYVNEEDAGDAEFKVNKVTAGTAISDISTIGIIKKGQDQFINIEPTAIDVGTGVKVELIQKNTRNGCLGTDDQEYAESHPELLKDGSYTLFTIEVEYVGMEGRKDNIYQDAQAIDNPHRQANGICTNFINGTYNTDQFKTSPIIKEEDFTAYNYAAVSQEGKTFYQEMIPYCFKDKVNPAGVYEDKKLVEMINDALSVWKLYVTPISGGAQSFNEAFNQIRDAALSAGTHFGTLANPATNPTLSYTNKCEYDQTDYVTKNYYTAQVVDSQEVTYTYNYAPGGEKTETKKVCDRVCEEAVKIEYGPPQATKAGLCFEYTVKVTSYVKCEAQIDPNAEPKIFDGSYCTPGGTCWSSDMKVKRNHPRAGPNEEFEECIMSCDGGKYTQACSLQCYKKAYKNSKNLKINYLDTFFKEVKQIGYTTEQCLQDNPDGCYIRSGGEIKWKEINQIKSFNTDMLARFYTPDQYWRVENKSYIVDTNGFMRAVYAGGVECTDICKWNTGDCGENEYLNPGSGVKDNERNLELYNSAVTACRAAASCSRTTKKYSISVKYNTQDNAGNVTINQVYFPYTSDSQLKQNPSGGEYSLVDKDQFINGAGYKNEKSTIIDYDGCYKDSVNNTNWYLTEWGFPGTYINNKTGDISFAEPTDMSGWYKEKQKFCVPLNALSTNEKWWEWKVMGDHCVNITATDIANINYNIEAVVEDFGYFDWDFNVKCFYGMYDECKVPDDNACCPPPGRTPDIARELQYVIRVVDRTDVFPNSDYSIPEEQRRTIGFNWTSRATIPSLKGNDLGGYWGVNPEEYKESIETNASTLYSGDPDYEFYLTPTDLRKLRSYNDRYSYGTWNGKVSEINGITAYQSNLFRTVGIEANVLTGDAIKQTGEPGVNNE